MNQINEIENVTINALSGNTLNIISSLLDPTKHFLTRDKLRRDWQGLASLCNVNPSILPSIQRSSEPTRKILQWWSKNDKNNATIQNLLSNFEQMDRFDIIEDIAEHVERDIQNYQNESVQQLELDFGNDVLTDDDVKNLLEGKGYQTFDAFILVADEDIIFARKLINTMKDKYNLKFCLKSENLVVGVAEHNSLIKLITERCRKLIVILSPAFFDSEQNKFLYSYTQSLQIELKQRKIIPCTYQERCALPPEYRYIFVLEYLKAEKTQCYNFWEKLHTAIKPVPQNRSIKEQPIDAEISTQLESPILQEESICLKKRKINTSEQEKRKKKKGSKRIFGKNNTIINGLVTFFVSIKLY